MGRVEEGRKIPAFFEVEGKLDHAVVVPRIKGWIGDESSGVPEGDLLRAKKQIPSRPLSEEPRT